MGAVDPGPVVWTIQGEMLGWQWRRKEIENYLVDPEVLTRALGWDAAKRGAYESSLERVLDDLGPATAARMALTACAPRKVRLATDVRLGAAEAELERDLVDIAAKYNEGARVEELALVETFRWCLPECRPGGRFRAQAREVFAGKNIVDRIQSTAGFDRELKNKDALFERVLVALERDAAPHEWLPEWRALRGAVESWEPPPQ